MEKETLKFEIDQLRKDKIIYGVEACATVLICLLGFFFSNQYIPTSIRDITNVILIIIAVGYTLYMGVGNFFRLQKILKLQQKLNK